MKVDHVEIAKLQLERGDLLVLRVPDDWDDSQQEDAHEAVKRAMHLADANVPIIIGPASVEFQIVRRSRKATA